MPSSTLLVIRLLAAVIASKRKVALSCMSRAQTGEAKIILGRKTSRWAKIGGFLPRANNA